VLIGTFPSRWCGDWAGITPTGCYAMWMTTFTEGFAAADMTEAKSLLLLSKSTGRMRRTRRPPRSWPTSSARTRDLTIWERRRSQSSRSRPGKRRCNPCSSQLLPSGSLKEAYMKEKAVGSRNKTPPLRWNTSLTLTQRLMMSSRRVDVGDDQLQTLSGAGSAVVSKALPGCDRACRGEEGVSRTARMSPTARSASIRHPRL
jgi:hypothetical protein